MSALLLAALPVALAAATSAVALPAAPPPLRGVYLERATGLRLLVANNPPFVLDVDSGRVTKVEGIPAQDRLTLSVHTVGQDAVIWLDRRGLRATGAPRGEIYFVANGTTTARRIATGWEVASSADGKGVWVKDYSSSSRCTLREIDIAGRDRRPSRPMRCATRVVDSGSGPMLVRDQTTNDPRTRRSVLSGAEVSAVAGRFALTRTLVVTDLRTSERWTPPAQSRVGGNDWHEAFVSRDRSRVAIRFAAARSGGMIDAWFLDLTTRRAEPLPDMPARVSLKHTSLAWSPDGQLAILEHRTPEFVLGIWRPGQLRIEVRRFRIPIQANSGSASFVAWHQR